jgi:hypothetical protein
MVHRLLRDDYYVGIVTRGGVKRRGRHEPLIDQETFDRVQEILSANRASGDRAHKHNHYLKGSIYCICGKRLGYGRHRGKCGGLYEYFSCLSRVQRGERCAAPYFAVERTERAIIRRYKREKLTLQQQADIRQDLRAYVETKAQVARRESERHKRRLRELTAQQQKLVQLYYNGGVSEEVLKAEQERIKTESAQAQQWADAANREVEDVAQALDDALALLDDNHVLYEELNPICRRLANQAIFLRITIIDPDTVEVELTPLYDHIAQLAQDHLDAKKPAQDGQKRPRNAKNKAKSPQNDRDPDFRGRGSYENNMAGATGLEPAASGVTGASTERPDPHESPLYKPNQSFREQGRTSCKRPHFTGFRGGFGHKSRLVPNRLGRLAVCLYPPRTPTRRAGSPCAAPLITSTLRQRIALRARGPRARLQARPHGREPPMRSRAAPTAATWDRRPRARPTRPCSAWL